MDAEITRTVDAESAVDAPPAREIDPPGEAPGHVESAAPAGPAPRRDWAPLWALLGALALAAIYARAALLNLTTAVVGGDLDGYENMWNNWWLKTALFNLHQNPYYDNYIYYPTGVDLYFHTFAPINGLLTLPLNLTIGYVPATNLLFVGLLAAATFCAWLFLRDLVGNGWAAFGGAALYAYANHLVVEYLNAGQSERLSAQWFPLYLFFLFRALYGRPQWSRDGQVLSRDTRRWRLWTGLAVLTLVAMSLADWQYVMVTVFTTVLYFVFVLFTRRSRREKAIIFGKLALVGGLYAVLITPLLIPTVLDALANPWLSVSYESFLHATDLFDLLGPGPANPGYLACAVCLLGLLAARRARGAAWQTALFWALAALIFWTMSFGPFLLVGGTHTDIPLPYSVLQNLPVFSIGRDPERYTLVARLGVGVLAAFGFAALFAWLPRAVQARPALQPLRRGRPLVAALLIVVFLTVDLGGWVAEAGGVKVDPPTWPPFYQQIAADPANYALLELPLFTEKGRGEDHYQMYQVLHGKPRFGGRYARDHKLTDPNNFVKHTGLFRYFWLLDSPRNDLDFYYPAQDFLQRTDFAAQGRAILNYYKARYIVVWKDAIDRDWDEAAFQQLLGQVLGPGTQPYYEDGQMRVYGVPDGPPAANPLTLDVGDGWFARGVREDGVVYRWADNSGGQPSELYSMNLTQAPIEATLHFTLYTFKQARTLQVAVNGTPVTTLTIRPDEGEKPISVDLTLPPGNNRISFTTPEPALPTGNPSDKRLLSFGMYRVSLQAK